MSGFVASSWSFQLLDAGLNSALSMSSVSHYGTIWATLHKIFITDTPSATVVQLPGLNIIVSNCHLPTLSRAVFSSGKSLSSVPEVLRIEARKPILIVESVCCYRVSALSCFLFLCFGRALTDLPLEELQHLKRKNRLYCSNWSLVERKQTLFWRK